MLFSSVCACVSLSNDAFFIFIFPSCICFAADAATALVARVFHSFWFSDIKISASFFSFAFLFFLAHFFLSSFVLKISSDRSDPLLGCMSNILMLTDFISLSVSLLFYCSETYRNPICTENLITFFSPVFCFVSFLVVWKYFIAAIEYRRHHHVREYGRIHINTCMRFQWIHITPNRVLLHT